ncbi:MAG: RDD family protein [Candidatus Altiarchaeota archaeon]
MAFCTKGGTEILEGGRFCRTCNKTQDTVDGQKPTTSESVAKEISTKKKRQLDDYSGQGALGITLKKASPPKRLFAYLLDAIIYLLILFIGFVPFFLSSFFESKILNFVGAVYFSLIFLVATILYLIKDGLFGGLSPGKWIIGLRVVDHRSKRPCTKTKSIIRNLSLTVLTITLVGGFIELILTFVLADGRRLGDKLAKTQVIDV